MGDSLSGKWKRLPLSDETCLFEESLVTAAESVEIRTAQSPSQSAQERDEGSHTSGNEIRLFRIGGGLQGDSWLLLLHAVGDTAEWVLVAAEASS